MKYYECVSLFLPYVPDLQIAFFPARCCVIFFGLSLSTITLHIVSQRHNFRKESYWTWNLYFDFYTQIWL